MWVEFEDDARLSQSRQRPGDYSPLTRDSDDHLGHVTLSDADEDDFESSSGSPSDPDPHDEWDAEEFEQQVVVIAMALALLVVGVSAAAPYVRQWWSDTAMPAIKSTGKKLKATLRRTPGDRQKRGADDSGDAASPTVRTRSGSAQGAASEASGPEMSSADAQQRFARAVVAAAYAEQQMRLLRNARISDDDDPLELASRMQELSPQRLEKAIHLLLEAEPTMLDREKLAAFEKTLAAGELAPVRRLHELPRSPGD